MEYNTGTYILGIISLVLFFSGFVLLLTEVDGNDWILMFLISRVVALIVMILGYKMIMGNPIIKKLLK